MLLMTLGCTKPLPGDSGIDDTGSGLLPFDATLAGELQAEVELAAEDLEGAGLVVAVSLSGTEL
ncbi:MAG TPA: hypothetical protein QGF58_25290 [Myxococcota bacterium]|nr:hypothetical protein [Myxococcota bacterium]